MARLRPMPPTQQFTNPHTGLLNRPTALWLQDLIKQVNVSTAAVPGAENNFPSLTSGGELEDSGIDKADVALLIGRNSGQTLQGGTSASEDLTLESTAHATKGDVICKDRFLLDTDGYAWVDVNLGVVSLGTGASAPGVVVLTGGIYVLGFDGVATLEQVFGSIELPHEWVEGTDIYPHIHWIPASAAAGNVKWQLEYTWTALNDVEPASTTISVTQAAPGALSNVRADFPAISGTGKLINSQFTFRLFRNPADAADTYGADARAKTFGIHLQVNTHGSRTQGAK